MLRWYKDNYLDLNVDKTREMAVDLRNTGAVSELIIEGVTVERVTKYKYLGTVLDNKHIYIYLNIIICCQYF